MVFISEKLRINWLLLFCKLRVKGCSHKTQPVMSQTQVLLTKIVKLCSEIHDIEDFQNKNHIFDKGDTRNNKTNLSKISDIRCSHNPVSLDTCAYHDQHGDDSSHSTPSSPSHPACRKGTALLCEPLPSHT